MTERTRFEVCKTPSGTYYWRAIARNGHVLCRSGTYSRYSVCELAMQRVISGAIDWRGDESPF